MPKDLAISAEFAASPSRALRQMHIRECSLPRDEAIPPTASGDGTRLAHRQPVERGLRHRLADLPGDFLQRVHDRVEVVVIDGRAALGAA
jgi:hypothetical protein